MPHKPLRTSLLLICSCVSLYLLFMSTFLLSFVLAKFVFSRQPEFHLELVQVLMRHGQRKFSLREACFENVQNVSDYEPWGELTNNGKMTMYRIGTMLRQRYDKFLGSLYYPQDIYAISTDVDRTKMSLQLVLAGLYPPQEDQQWNSDLKWLAIPTYYIPEKVDIVMRSYQCPLYIAALEEVKNMNEVRDEVALYHDFFEFLSNKTELTITEPKQVSDFYHGLMAKKCMNLTLPEWYTNEVHQKMQKVTLMQYNISSYTTELKRLNGGFLVKRFIDNMNPRGDPKNKPSRKIYIYSGHELNIAGFAKSHNMANLRLPDYGSTFIVEKLRDNYHNSYVKIVYWTGVTQELITMKLKHCDEICPMETYLELTRDVIPSDKEMTCLWDNITKEELLKLYSEHLIWW